jgi:signal transduction histidine kinase
MIASSNIHRDFPALVLPQRHHTIAGLLYIPLITETGQDFIVFLRQSQTSEIQWAGKPYKDEQQEAGADLEPRKSFEIWSETIVGRSRAWSDIQKDCAGVLGFICGSIIQASREKQQAAANRRLGTLLVLSASHAIRTPLKMISNTISAALAGDVGHDERQILEDSRKASRALLFNIHDLLDLTRIEVNNETTFDDPIVLRELINDAVRLYATESTRRGLDFNINLAPDLPEQVIGDSRKITAVISSLVANAVQYTAKGYIEVYCGLQRNVEAGAGILPKEQLPIEIVVSDSGCGIPADKLEAMFITLEGAEHMRSESAGVGLGLAVVARIAEQVSGQLRAESEVGVGSRFSFSLRVLYHAS